MVSYVVKYLHNNYPENLGIMIHLIGHDKDYRKKVSEITEEMLNHHDNLFVVRLDHRCLVESPVHSR